MGVPLTDGFHSRVSDGNETVVIVGNKQHRQQCSHHVVTEAGAVGSRTEPAGPDPRGTATRLVRSSDDEAMPLHVGRLAGASPIVFIDTTSSAVSIRAVDLESGKIRWTGSAHYRDMRIKEPGDSQHDIDVPGARHRMGIPRARRYLHSLATDVPYATPDQIAD